MSELTNILERHIGDRPLIEISQRADVPLEDLEKIMAGSTTAARPRHLFYLAKYFGISYAQLMKAAGHIREARTGESSKLPCGYGIRTQPND